MSFSRSLLSLSDTAGAYRWFYADVTGGGYSAVFIFMVGAPFSPRYAVAARRGGRPLEHCAVNFALYHHGARRRWVLSEYPEALVEEDCTLRIGRSSLTYEADGVVRMEVDERAAPWGPAVRASLALEPRVPAAEELELARGLPHWWRALVPRARARMRVASEGVEVEGLGYHDTNHGEEPLGARLSGWCWLRVHGPRETVVDYRLLEGVSLVRVVGSPAGTRCERVRLGGEALPTSLTSWGLRVPVRLQAGEVALGMPRLLESSPFYARMEAREGEQDALGEVADFRRFQSPFVRWMAHFRTRVERRA